MKSFSTNNNCKKPLSQSGLLKGLANDTWRAHLLLESDQWCSVLVVSVERYTAGTHQQGEY